MQSIPNTDGDSGSKVALDIPLGDTALFGSQAVHAVLSLLSRYPAEEFSITELARTVDYSQPTVSKAVDVLSANDLVVERREGTSRTVRINRDRLQRPDDPFLEIPQPAFQPPVRTAVEQLVDELDGVVGTVLYGSVARGDADRRSDVDLWVLVEEDRMANQRAANRVRQRLEEQEFDTGRYEYDVDVEALPAVPNYAAELREILSEGLVVYETEEFETVRELLFHEGFDE